MRHFHKQKNHYHCPIVNLDKLWALVGEEVSTVVGHGVGAHCNCRLPLMPWYCGLWQMEMVQTTSPELLQ
jgi:hypothetical protein